MSLVWIKGCHGISHSNTVVGTAGEMGKPVVCLLVPASWPRQISMQWQNNVATGCGGVFFSWRNKLLLVPPGFAFSLTATTKKQKTPVVALLTLSGQGSIPCGVLLFLVCCMGQRSFHVLILHKLIFFFFKSKKTRNGIKSRGYTPVLKWTISCWVVTLSLS